MSLQAIMQAAQLKADGKAQRVIVTGCLAQRYSEDLAGTPLPPYTCLGIHELINRVCDTFWCIRGMISSGCIGSCSNSTACDVAQ